MKKMIFTAMEVAKILCVSLPTVNRLLNSGDLKGFRPSKNANWKVTKRELVKYMLEQNIPMEFLNGDKKKVLIVDDELDITNMVERTYKDIDGYLVESANSGFAAGAKLESFKPDIVILDIFLNDMDGREFFKHIRKDNAFKNIKVIGISGKMTENDIKPMLELGFDDFVTKPFKMEKLIEIVSKSLGQ